MPQKNIRVCPPVCIDEHRDEFTTKNDQNNKAAGFYYVTVQTYTDCKTFISGGPASIPPIMAPAAL